MSALRTLGLLVNLWRTNLLSAMEYRFSFVTLILGMIFNNVIFFVFWLLFFDRFENVRGWTLQDMMLLFSVVATAFGLCLLLFGNCNRIAMIIAEGDLDRYLSLPRPVLLHLLASRSSIPSLGDLAFGLIWFAVAGNFSLGHIAKFVLCVFLAVCTFTFALVLVNSLAFWLGRSEILAEQFQNAMITFSLYPGTLFEGTARVFLFTLVPAGLTGALPVELLREFDLATLGWLCMGTGLVSAAAILVFHRGLHRYESGSAIQVRI